MLDGVIQAIEDGWFQGEIADAAHDFQLRLDSGEFVFVGVNQYTEGDDASTPTLSIDPVVEERQLKRLADVKATRNDDAGARRARANPQRRRRFHRQSHARAARRRERVRHRRRDHHGVGVGLRHVD